MGKYINTKCMKRIKMALFIGIMLTYVVILILATIGIFNLIIK